MRPRSIARTTALTVAALALALTAACSGGSSEDGDGSGGASGGDVSQEVIAPEGPGEPARTLTPEEAQEQAAEGTEPNAADFTFMRMMPVHHQQALDMTALAAEHAQDEAVRRIAARVAAAQGPEIDVMDAWVTRNAGTGADDGSGGDDGHGGHGAEGHGDMPGMASEEELAALAAARGAEFDALFLDLMIAHHEGAVTMATELLTSGNAGDVAQLATDMMADQSVEIDRMRGLG
ncbi:DUF305 domain-containing protein [Streptomyces avicenniae]|uniref:DUF305 domain-containing protein n=1 Tax=Streptomyces avicenniae TaxID=500153 RepID=UPI000B25BDE8|nr:DUF305 domain-containing protein [Streptomyces avicenniae]